MFKYFAFLLILLQIVLNDSIGQKCSLPSHRRGYGICRRWSECESAQSDYKNQNITPIYCQYQYDRYDPIVCCQNSPTFSSGDIISFNVPSINLQSEKIRNQRISAKMCEVIYHETPVTTTTTTTAYPSNQGYYGIGGGFRAAPGEFTHMTAIGWKKKPLDDDYDFLCGGTLISENFVLTAAHCTSLKGKAPEIVRVGGEPLVIYGALDPNIPIERIYLHPQYQRRQFYNDIALLKLKDSSKHKPACLWQTFEIQSTTATAIGYGRTKFEGDLSNDLMQVDLNIFSNEDCKTHYNPRYKLENGIIDSQLCAGDLNGKKDTCQGDSGGPLLLKINESEKVIPYILGITSFGQGCAGGAPSIYVRVSFYLDWIESIVWL